MPPPAQTTDRHRLAIRRAARMGGSLAAVVRDGLRSAMAGVPERVGPHDLVRVRSHVAGVAERVRAVLTVKFRALLTAAAEREHLWWSRHLTRAANNIRGVTNVSEDWRDYVRLLIPAPALDFLENIVGPLWRRIVGAIAPERASNAVLQGIAAGKDRKAIAKDLEQVFDGYEVAARRVALTAGLEVATRTQLAVSEQIPDLVVGYELNTVLDERVRTEHRKMHGAKFYRVPKAGQRGLDQCPQPPVWDGKVAWNCRCFLSPIIQIDGEEV